MLRRAASTGTSTTLIRCRGSSACAFRPAQLQQQQRLALARLCSSTVSTSDKEGVCVCVCVVVVCSSDWHVCSSSCSLHRHPLPDLARILSPSVHVLLPPSTTQIQSGGSRGSSRGGSGSSSSWWKQNLGFLTIAGLAVADLAVLPSAVEVRGERREGRNEGGMERQERGVAATQYMRGDRTA